MEASVPSSSARDECYHKKRKASVDRCNSCESRTSKDMVIRKMGGFNDILHFLVDAYLDRHNAHHIDCQGGEENECGCHPPAECTSRRDAST